MSKKIIRVGDYVKIVNSRFIKRVGYPLVWTDLIDEVKKDPRTRKAWDVLTGHDAETAATLGELWNADGEPEFPQGFIRVIARLRVEERRFGGNDRTLHYYETLSIDAKLIWSATSSQRADYTGYTFQVTGKKIVKTGKRVAPSSGRSGYWEPEDWYDAGGLENCKTHVLLDTTIGLIEQVDVELVKRAPGSTDKYPAGSKYAPKSKIS